MSDVWVERIKAVSAAVTAILAAVGVLIGAWNNSKLSGVQEHQIVNSQKIDDARTKVDEVHANVADVKKSVDAMK